MDLEHLHSAIKKTLVKICLWHIYFCDVEQQLAYTSPRRETLLTMHSFIHPHPFKHFVPITQNLAFLSYVAEYPSNHDALALLTRISEI